MADIADRVTEILTEDIAQAIYESKNRENYLTRINNCINNIERVSQIIKTENNNLSRWKYVIDKKYTVQKPTKINEEKFKEVIFNAYHEIIDILTELKIIHSVQYSLVVVGKEYQYFRLKGGLQYKYFDLDDSRYKNKEKSDQKVLSMKLKESLIRQYIDFNEVKQQEYTKKLNEHFQNFIQPYLEWQRQSRETTQWSPSRGVMAEAFERHLEKNRHDFEKAPWDYDLESKGERWWMYRLSSGSEPFFTGPDTEISQVKTTSGNLVNDLDTIINTLMGMKVLFTDSDSKKRYTNKQLQQIFRQREINNRINYNIWEGAKEEGQKEIIRLLREIDPKAKTIEIVKTENNKTVVVDTFSLSDYL